MKVLGKAEIDPWKPGFYLRGGDVVRPLNGGWLKPPYPTRYWHFFCKLRVLPFLSVRIGRFGFYIGFKCFGVYHDQYKEWFRLEHQGDIDMESRALAPSARWSNSR